MTGPDNRTNRAAGRVTGPDGVREAAPVPVGLVGAGPWASTMHAPTLAAGPDTRLAAVWSRRPEAAAELAGRYGAVAVTDLTELFDRCLAVAFAVPPDVQASLAVTAAKAGRALLLEKPLALDLAAARRLTDAVDSAGVVSQLVLTKRYHPDTRTFLAEAAGFDAIGARASYLHGAFLGGPMATDWRRRWGALFDLGPHLIDLVDTAVGPIGEIRATGDSRRWIELTCTHHSGVVSQLSLSGSVRVSRSRTVIELYGPAGELRFDVAALDHSACWPVIAGEFAAAVRSGRSPELDVHRGLYLQQLIHQAANRR